MIKKDIIPTYEQSLKALSDNDEQVVRQAIFPLKYFDGDYVVQVAEAIRSLLKHPGLTPAQIVSVGRALHGLNRMPLRTPGLDIRISLSIVNPSGYESYRFYISGNKFYTKSGGHVDSGCGYDSLSGATFDVDMVGRDIIESNMGGPTWPEVFAEMILADLDIEDDSDDSLMDWEHPDGSLFWEWIAKHD